MDQIRVKYVLKLLRVSSFLKVLRVFTLFLRLGTQRHVPKSHKDVNRRYIQMGVVDMIGV